IADAGRAGVTPYSPRAFAASQRQPLSRDQMLSRQLNCVLGSKPNDDIMLNAMDCAVPGSGAGTLATGAVPPPAAAPVAPTVPAALAVSGTAPPFRTPISRVLWA